MGKDDQADDDVTVKAVKISKFAKKIGMFGSDEPPIAEEAEKEDANPPVSKLFDFTVLVAKIAQLKATITRNQTKAQENKGVKAP